MFRIKGAPATVALGNLGDPPRDGVFGLNDNNIVSGQYVNSLNAGTCNAMAWKWNGSTGGTMVDFTVRSFTASNNTVPEQ